MTSAGALRISLCSDASSWLNPWLTELRAGWQADGHAVEHVHAPAEIPDGDLCFLLSLGRIVTPEALARNTHNLVVHESDLPKGRGWSPMTWQVLEGAREIPICLFEAAEGVDSGVVYLRERYPLDGTELVQELRAAQAAATLRMCRSFVAQYPAIIARGEEQQGEPSLYPRRRPEDSRLDPDATLREQLNLLRVVDNRRYPAFFDVDGQRYYVQITKEHPGEDV